MAIVRANGYLLGDRDRKYFKINPSVELWTIGARIYYDLRRRGITVRNTIDCCIAASAIENDLILLHLDRDFEAIAKGTALNQIRLQ